MKGDGQLLQIAAALNCLSVLFFHLPVADTDKALVHCHLALKTYRSVLGEDVCTKEVATVLNNSGRILFLREHYKTGLSVYQ